MRGNNEYDVGQYEASLDLYRTAQAQHTAPELSHNAANALDQLRQYDAAVEEALKARGRSGDDAAQEAQIEYGIGNHYVGAGNLFSAIEAYKRSLLADSTDEDAKHNRGRDAASTPTATTTPPAFEVTDTRRQPTGGPQPDAPEERPRPGEAAAGTLALSNPPRSHLNSRASRFSACSRRRSPASTASSRRRKRSASSTCYARRTAGASKTRLPGPNAGELPDY